MLYHLIQYLERSYDIPGQQMFLSISFRTGVGFILALLVATVFGRKIINRLQKMQIGETIRDLGMEDQLKKKGTPTMGGIIIILAILVPTLLLADLTNIYIILMLITTVWMGIIGFSDDYLKIKYRNKEGLKGQFKIFGQVGLGLIVGLTLYLSPNVLIRENVEYIGISQRVEDVSYKKEGVKSTKTTIPFFRQVLKHPKSCHQQLRLSLSCHAVTGFKIISHAGLKQACGRPFDARKNDYRRR